MPWNIWRFYTTLFVSIIADWMCCAQGLKLPPIHWNSSNPMFKSSSNDHIIEVNLRDELDIICPYYVDENSYLANSPYEYYIVHEVTKSEYDNCSLYHHTYQRPKMIVNCSSPREKKFFTIWFEPFTPIPDVPEFKSGETHYFITTSIGDKYGIANSAMGACVHKNMKITIKILEEPTTPTTTPPSRTTKVTTPTMPATTSTVHQPTVHRTSTPQDPPTSTVIRTTTPKLREKDKDKDNERDKHKLVSSGTIHHISGVLLGCAVLLVSLLRGLLSR